MTPRGGAPDTAEYYEAARTDIEAIDPRMIKSAARVGIGASSWRWRPWDEPEEVREKYAKQKRAGDAANAASEIEGLDGGAEPAWPSFPKAEPTLRRGSRIVLSPTARAAIHVEVSLADLATARAGSR